MKIDIASRRHLTLRLSIIHIDFQCAALYSLTPIKHTMDAHHAAIHQYSMAISLKAFVTSEKATKKIVNKL